MKDLRTLNTFRLRGPHVVNHFGNVGDETRGMFSFKSNIDRAQLRVVASSDRGWDHVSVSRTKRCPNWLEMQQIYKLFFEDDETAIQLHVPASDHINCHPHCLHLWRPQNTEIPRPPAIMVGPPEEAA